MVVISSLKQRLDTSKKPCKELVRASKCVFVPGPGIAINSISVSSSFCATGSEDGFLRLWPLDFSSVFLEAGRNSGVWHNIYLQQTNSS